MGLALLALLALYAAILAGQVGAQELAPAARVEALARICVAEAGWEPATGDCAAIAHVILRRARRLGLRPRTMARRYSRRHFDATRTDERRWIVGRELRGAEPAGWPAGLDWREYRARWLEMVEHVRELLAGSVSDPCGGEADHWGAPYGVDLARARRAGWRRLDCGPTRNAFWSIDRGER